MIGISVSFETRFLLLAFAVYRGAELLTQDRGPFDIFLRFRIVMGAYDRDETGEPQTELGRLANCPYCTGIWLSLPALLMLVFVPFSLEGFGLLWLGALWLAISGLQAFLETLAGRAQADVTKVALDTEAQSTFDRLAERLGK